MTQSHKTILVALAAILAGGLWIAPASAQQISPASQRLVNGVAPQRLQQACAGGQEGMTALVRDLVQTADRNERGVVGGDAQGGRLGAALNAKCPK